MLTQHGLAARDHFPEDGEQWVLKRVGPISLSDPVPSPLTAANNEKENQ